MFNKAIVIGRLTKNPELKQTPAGVSVCSFSIACNRNYADKNGERQTDFLNIVAWRGQAEFVCRYFTKGSLIGVEGSIQSRNYTDKDGNSRNAVEIVGSNFFFVESKSSSSNSENRPSPYTVPGEAPAAPAYSSGSVEDFAEIEGEEDLPF